MLSSVKPCRGSRRREAGGVIREVSVLRSAGRIYLFRMCEDPCDQAKMAQIGTPSASQFTAKNRTAGKRYWFEVAAVGPSKHSGPWSDPATGTAI